MSTLTTTDYTGIDVKTAHFCWRDDRLQYRQGDGAWQPVTVNALFPFADPDGWISVRDADGSQVGIIESMHKLSSESQQAIRQEIKNKRFLPVVRRIVACRDIVGMCQWELETDRGRITCTVRPSSQTLFEISHNRYLLIDIVGNRYDMQLARLDADSRLRLAKRI